MDYAALLQLATTMYGQQAAEKMSQKQLELLQQHLQDVQGVQLPNLPQVTADQLGASALGSMGPDENMRGKQLQALGEIQNIIDSGGLNFEDKASLEEAMQTAQNQQHRAQAGVAADAASRGQLNSGNRLLMDMNAASQGANAARQTGLATAAQAQQRRLAAIQQASGIESNLRNQDWGEKSQAAAAKDARDQLNAAAREKAQYYNAGLPQQGFNNALAKATGTGNPTNALASALQNAGMGIRGDTAGMVGAEGAIAKGFGGQGGGNSYTYNYDSGEQADLSGNRGGASDLSDGHTDDEEYPIT